MPNITLIRDHLFEEIGKHYTDAEFDELCFEFGVEVDDISTEVVEFTGNGTKEELVVYVIAIPANRYDLLCIEGFSRAIRVFIGLETTPLYRSIKVEAMNQMLVDKSTAIIRPYIACAILRGIHFDIRRYKSFIDLQEKLHQNICRRRTYVAIGTHDLDTVKGPFRYAALPPQEIHFVPLTEDHGKSCNAKELLDFYRQDPTTKHLKSYTNIIYDSPVYPVVLDSNNTVLSLPPIINGKHSRIQMHTKNIFIECTGTDLTKVNIVLDTIVTMFSQYCTETFSVEPVGVTYEAFGDTSLPIPASQITPLLSTRVCDAKVDDINGTIGIHLAPDQICGLCKRMQLGPAVYLSDKNSIQVTIPPTRSDILHPVDIIEDVAIAYGYNNIKLEIPKTLCDGAPLRINQFTDLLRAEISRAGYMEMLTHGLCSLAENFTNLRRTIGPAVSLLNPANVEYEVVRTTLMPGALKTLAHNNKISHKDGIQLFEISDVVIPYPNEVGAKNVRKMVALYSSFTASLEKIHGLADRIMTSAQIQPNPSYAANSLTTEEFSSLQRVSRKGIEYSLKSSNDPCYFSGMSADFVLKLTDEESGVVTERIVGSMGVVHPEVLQSFGVEYPCSILELDVEELMPK